MTRYTCLLILLAGGMTAVTLIPLDRAAETRAAPPSADPARVVVLAGAMPDADMTALAVMTAAATPDADFLLDTPRAGEVVRPFLERLNPGRVVPVGTFPKDHDPTARWGVRAPVVLDAAADPVAYAWSLYPKAARVVVAPRTPADQFLQAACLAGATRAPLFVLRDGADPVGGLKELLASRGVTDVIAVGAAAEACKNLGNDRVTTLADAAAVAAAHRRELTRGGPIRNLVLANPADAREAPLAPWVAVRRRAALLLTAGDGKDAGAVVAAALTHPNTAAADALIVLARPDAIPTAKRANPAEGKDERIDVEPWIPEGHDLVSLAAGRLFHDDRAVLPLLLARQRLFERNTAAPKILIASNPGDGLPLLETFSRNTGRELENAGCVVTGRYGKTELTGKELRELVPEHDVFLWEGHYRTLIDTYELPKWTERLRPSVVFLQSCLALNPADAGLLLDRGAMAVIGSPNRAYSGSGGALSLGFFDALAYDGREAGAAMRHAKNFLLCYAELKEKRLGDGAKLGGANRRAAWTFTVWGDPTIKLSRPVAPADALPRLTTEATKTTITLSVPQKRYPATDVKPYHAEMWPGGRLAGLFTTDGEDSRRLSPLAFSEVPFSQAPAGKIPRLSTKLPAKNWLFKWDARRKVGHLLVLPREKDGNSILFRVHWEVPGAPDNAPPAGKPE